MFLIGDKVKLNVEAIRKNGMDETEEQSTRFHYIETHPDEVYTINDIVGYVSAPYTVDHLILGATSFSEDEMILIQRGEFKYELSK